MDNIPLRPQARALARWSAGRRPLGKRMTLSWLRSPTARPIFTRQDNGAVIDGSTHANTTRIVVPVDGSPFAERAPARGCVALAAVGVSMHLVEVVRPDDDVERAGR